MPASKKFFARLPLAILPALVAGIIAASPVQAVPPQPAGPSGSTTSTSQSSTSSTKTSPDPCANTDSSSGQVSQSKLQNCVTQTPVVHDINLIVNFLSIGVGLIVIAMILVGGVQYIAAGDNSQAVTSAKQHITNAFIALFVYIFIFAFLQWLIPGGLFSK